MKSYLLVALTFSMLTNNILSMQQDPKAQPNALLSTPAHPSPLLAPYHVAQLSYQIQALHVSSHKSFEKIDSRISLAQRACDLLGQVERSRNTVDEQTNVLLSSLIQLTHTLITQNESNESTLQRVIKKIEQQDEQQQQMLQLLKQLTEKKTTHEIATQTDTISQHESSAPSSCAAAAATPQVKPLCVNPSKTANWKKKQPQ